MLKIKNTAGGSLTAGQVIPFTLDFNTNQSTSYSDNTITINKAGYYDVSASAVISPSGTGNISMQLYANNVAIPEAIATITPASGGTYTLNINNIERVIRDYTNVDKVKLTFKISAAATLVSASASVVEIR